jgi:hypothetical protein
MTFEIIDWSRPDAYFRPIPRSLARRLLARLDRWLVEREAHVARREARRTERVLRSHSQALPAYIRRDLGLD